LPAGVPQGGQGPRLQATAALLTGTYRLSKRQVESLLADLHGVPLCAGQVCALEQQTCTALTPVVDELRQTLRQHPVNMDETSWREGTSRPWLWVGVTAYLTVYHLVASRGADVVTALLGADYAHVLTSDRFKAYNGIPLRQRQACWAHLRRDFQAMIDRGEAGTRIGEDLLLHADILLGLWYKVRDGTRTRKWLVRQIEEWVRPEVRRLLQRGTACGCAKTAGTCTEILKVEESLWTFARVEGVEPTNNAAERALRHPVLWRTVSRGTRSLAGSQFVATILSVVETCRQQGRNVLEYLTACCQAALDKAPAPSLLPQPGSG
jgi:transposase